MTFHIFTLFPEIFQGYLESSILRRAIEKGFVILELINIRDYARDKHKTCDDSTYGGGAGMVLKPEPLAEALMAAGADRKKTESGRTGRVIYLTPSGRLWNQKTAEQFKDEESISLICGRYEGIDQRIIDLYVTDEISIGDYILSGGEVAAMVLVDTLTRLIEGVIKERSLEEESFRRGLLEYPQYTRPYEFQGYRVPDILLSGHHAEIERWRLKKSIEKTLEYRPELLEKQNIHPEILHIVKEIRGENDG